jgi:hypothetical protein
VSEAATAHRQQPRRPADAVALLEASCTMHMTRSKRCATWYLKLMGVLPFMSAWIFHATQLACCTATCVVPTQPHISELYAFVHVYVCSFEQSCDCTMRLHLRSDDFCHVYFERKHEAVLPFTMKTLHTLLDSPCIIAMNARCTPALSANLQCIKTHK